MDSSKVPVVICLTIIIVIGVNAVIFGMLRRGNEARQVELLRKAARTMRQPWSVEDQNLQELSRKVAEIKARQGGGPNPAPSEEQDSE
jgi:uncharacterized membrane protein affecting hemolysin expression